jgi:PAS domain S-box-containing protein
MSAKSGLVARAKPVRFNTILLARRPLLLRYGIALLLVTLAALGQWALLGARTPFVLLLPAIMVVAWYGGLGPGLLATALSTLVAAYLFFEPLFSLQVDNVREILALALFAFLGIAMSVLFERLKRSERARQQAEERALLETKDSLRESRMRLRAVVETAVDAIITIDERGVIDSVNPAAERMFGYPATEMIGQNVTMMMPSPYREEHNHYVARYLRTGEKHIIGIGREVQGRRKDGSTFPANLSVSEFHDRTQHMFSGILHDLSARKALERDVLEAAAMEQWRIGQELHDSTGQELTALGMLAEGLVEALTKSAPAEAELATKIAESVKRVLGHVRALSRGLIPVEVDAAGLMAALAELASETSELHGVTCTFECREPVLVEDNQTATHLYRIAKEAVTNALKHSRAKNIIISLVGDERSLTLGVRDDGVGFPREPMEVKGMGLKIMRYRAGLINATLSVGPVVRGGTLVSCTINKSANDGQEQAQVKEAGGQGPDRR